VVGAVLASDTVGDDGAVLDARFEDRSVELGETELLGKEDLLSAGELELRSSESFAGSGFVLVFDSDGHEWLSNSNTSDETLGFTVGTSHTSLESISSSARQHLVDSDDVEWMDSHTEMESILTDGLDEVLVGADSSSFHSFRGKLFQFVGDHDDVSWEEEDGGLLRSKIVDSDLRVWDTSAESRLGVRLVLAIPIASGWAATHGC